MQIKKYGRIVILTLLITLIIISQTACKSNGNGENQGVSKTGFFLDTVCTVTIYGISDESGEMAKLSKEELEKDLLMLITDAFKQCSEYEKILSKTIDGSEIFQINQSGGDKVKVSDVTVDVLQKGIEYGNLSEGVFDITIGKATDLWDFHDDENTGKIPSEKLLDEAVKHVDYRNIEIEDNFVRLKDPETEINLGGVAKGYIADRIAEYLEKRGVVSAIVDLGGNIVVIGSKSAELVVDAEQVADNEQRDFRIGIKNPKDSSGNLLGTVPCSDKTVVTSGTYERFFEADGKKYHHVLDVKTGYPVNTDVISVTIIGDKGKSADCDALSTTCLALGLEKGMKLIKSMDGFEAVFVNEEGEIFKTGDFLKN